MMMVEIELQKLERMIDSERVMTPKMQARRRMLGYCWRRM
jgi:hypothetical protein